ncbi:ribonuclease H [Senna tora]|uniref:Ribonuclease H n=1 Tax=Senna tora TaxID=362788 RepID=A0A834W885_9FABA|nr:ribonuclease H [Senna tora]
MCHNSILIEQQRHKRNLTDSDTYKRCNSTSETVLHCVRDWPMVFPLWEALIDADQKNLTKNDQRCHIKWYPPSPGWIKLNMDRFHHNTTGSSACVGVTRDENGNWLFGFARRLGKRNAIYVDMWGIIFGVRIAKETAKHAIQERIREIAKDNWQVIFSHTLREGKRVADALPNHGHRVHLDIVMFDNPPSWCSDLYQDDLSDLGLSRLVPC